MRRMRASHYRRQRLIGHTVNRADVNPVPANIGADPYEGSNAHRRRELPSDPLCTCWCEKNVGPVSLDDIARGITWSCGRPDCHPPRKETE